MDDEERTVNKEETKGRTVRTKEGERERHTHRDRDREEGRKNKE